ncbi:hypothetical protein SAMN02745163_00912 [Clostridium cavendishii DSM 21758]|uniref:Lipoprotein n=1 Tax=Clostridium cavendishii DSM 21758 TaxID=1121302 RepID=A0A1M6EPM3_9CLOT|nr:hypothetical protein [Clostridium cavendishii]SHI87477.1 hypothetical protein SAMN02745163_00912 [Clostridium cavendishii DSM 21758]
MKKRSIAIITIILISTFSLNIVSCANNKNNEEKASVEEKTNIDKSKDVEKNNSEENEEAATKDNEESKEVKSKGEYNKELAKIFPNKKDTKTYYSGILDYSSIEELNDVKEEDGVLNLKFKGQIDDLSGGAAGKKTNNQYSYKYVIDNEYVRQVFDYHSKNPKRPVSFSRAVLRLPFKTGNTWSAAYLYEGKKYTGKTKIEEVTTKNNITKIKTVTIIDGINGFKNKQYKETKIYETGKGVVAEEFNTTTEGINFNIKQTKIK